MTSTIIHNYYLACAENDFMQFSTGIIPPVAAPTYPNRPAEYYNSVTKFLYRWNLGTQTWQPVPKTYRALLSQSGTTAPILVVLENTLGVTIAWTRSDVGMYMGTAAAPVFVENKCSFELGPARFQVPSRKYYAVNFLTDLTFILVSNNSAGTPTDSLLDTNLFSLGVYP